MQSGSTVAILGLASRYGWVSLPEQYRVFDNNIIIGVAITQQAELARACQVPHAVVTENGAVVELDPDNPRIIDHVTAGRLALDGERLVPMSSPVVWISAMPRCSPR